MICLHHHLNHLLFIIACHYFLEELCSTSPPEHSSVCQLEWASSERESSSQNRSLKLRWLQGGNGALIGVIPALKIIYQDQYPKVNFIF